MMGKAIDDVEYSHGDGSDRCVAGTGRHYVMTTISHAVICITDGVYATMHSVDRLVHSL